MFRIDWTEERRCLDFKPTDSILRIVRRSSKTEAHGGESPPQGIYSRDPGRMGSSSHPPRLAQPGRYCNLQRGSRLRGNSNFDMHEGISSDVCRSRRSLLSLPACKPRRIGFLERTGLICPVCATSAAASTLERAVESSELQESSCR
jgi:hypothetical protein